ncbi:MAG: hypothetical protein IPH78_14855 [Bacteroidetes bacterium]|nr:hypothetical protein [Bacteroidota bacterium]
MKKIYTLLASIVLFANTSFGQCVIDNSNTAFFSPAPDSIPCVERGVPYNQVIQIKVPTTIDLADFGSPIPFVLTVDSLVITNVSGIPSRAYLCAKPCQRDYVWGDNGCGQVQGTTNDPVGNYPLDFTGFIFRCTVSFSSIL